MSQSVEGFNNGRRNGLYSWVDKSTSRFLMRPFVMEGLAGHFHVTRPPTPRYLHIYGQQVWHKTLFLTSFSFYKRNSKDRSKIKRVTSSRQTVLYEFNANRIKEFSTYLKLTEIDPSLQTNGPRGRIMPTIQQALGKEEFTHFETDHRAKKPIVSLYLNPHCSTLNKHESFSVILVPIHSFAVHRPIHEALSYDLISSFHHIYAPQDPWHSRSIYNSNMVPFPCVFRSKHNPVLL